MGVLSSSGFSQTLCLLACTQHAQLVNTAQANNQGLTGLYQNGRPSGEKCVVHCMPPGAGEPAGKGEAIRAVNVAS